MKYLKLLCVVFMCVFLTACGDSNIDKVKNSPSHVDKSVTYEQLLNSYKYLTDIEWIEEKGERGETLVKARGTYNYAYNPVTKGAFTKEDFVAWVKKSGGAYFSFDFAMDADGEGFEPMDDILVLFQGKIRKTKPTTGHPYLLVKHNNSLEILEEEYFNHLRKRR